MEDQFVDVRYRGLDAGRRLRISGFASGEAYLEHSAPMPVGTRLEIVGDDGQVVVVRVTGVTEQVAGAERAPGMNVVWLEAREGDADPAPAPERDETGEAADPDDGEQPGASNRLGTADTQSLTDAANLATLESAATLDLSRAAVAQATAESAETDGDGDGENRRETARTQVMNVSELQAALAESESAVDPGEPVRKPVDTEVMFAIAPPDAEGEESAEVSPPREPEGTTKARGKRRRRRRRKTRS